MIITQMSKASARVLILQLVVGLVAFSLNGRDIANAIQVASGTLWLLAFGTAVTSLFTKSTYYIGNCNALVVAGALGYTVTAFLRPDVHPFLPWAFFFITFALLFVVVVNAKYRWNAKEPAWALALAIAPLGIGLVFGFPLALAFRDKAKENE